MGVLFQLAGFGSQVSVDKTGFQPSAVISFYWFSIQKSMRQLIAFTFSVKSPGAAFNSGNCPLRSFHDANVGSVLGGNKIKNCNL